jgi:hypothetical protein
VVAFIITSSKEKSLIGLQVFGDPYVSCWIMETMASYDSHVALILQTIATYCTNKDYFLLPINKAKQEDSILWYKIYLNKFYRRLI